VALVIEPATSPCFAWLAADLNPVQEYKNDPQTRIIFVWLPLVDVLRNYEAEFIVKFMIIQTSAKL
jgi:hypothetical protein